jgi:hypothetical protein
VNGFNRISFENRSMMSAQEIDLTRDDLDQPSRFSRARSRGRGSARFSG